MACENPVAFSGRAVRPALAALLVMVMCGSTRADHVAVGGLIGSDTIWTAGDTILVTDTVRVGVGVILTIEPGAVVQFGSLLPMHVSGRLNAIGTPSERIVFTSPADTAGGNPVPSQWGGLTLQPGASGDLVQCDVRYATDAVVASGDSLHVSGGIIRDFGLRGLCLLGSVSAVAPVVTVDHCFVGQTNAAGLGKGAGIYAYRNLHLTVAHSCVTSCRDGIYLVAYCEHTPKFTIHDCNVRGQADMGIRAASSG